MTRHTTASGCLDRSALLRIRPDLRVRRSRRKGRRGGGAGGGEGGGFESLQEPRGEAVVTPMSGGEQDVDVIIEDPDQEMGKQALERQVCSSGRCVQGESSKY